MHVHDANESVNGLVLAEVVVLNGSGNAMLLQGAASGNGNGNGNVGAVVRVNESDRRCVHAMSVNYVSGHGNANDRPVK